MTRILFVGDTWQGSSARSLREALAVNPHVVVNDVGVDRFLPNYTHLPLRVANRVLRRLQVRELEGAVLRALNGFRPDVLVVHKGIGINASLIAHIREAGVPTVNVFPDCSPHAHGKQLHDAIGCYDLVISNKPYHPPHWRSVYGYNNRCVCVPHGYDPTVHYWPKPPDSAKYDVALCGTWRAEYHQHMRAFAKALGDDSVSVAIGGVGWEPYRNELPSHWELVGPRVGRTYGEFLRSARVALAPVTRELVIRGVRQPGDEETTRTYELAAAQCFFIHQRTDFVSTVYDEATEVPFWSDGAEMAELVRRWLPDESGRRAMAARAHARAVPAYSIPNRAAQVLRYVEAVIENHTCNLQSA
jgi:glycosyltransferase involved in cell wall biosynthesis